MDLLRQMVLMTGLNIRSLPLRVGSSSVIVVGIAAVVVVLVSALAVSAGILQTLEGTGRLDRAIVLRSGAAGEIASAMDRGQVQTIIDSPGIKRLENGKPAASAEVLTTVSVGRRGSAAAARVSLRGVRPAGFLIRPELHIVSGRNFSPGRSEVIAGRSLAGRLSQLRIGGSIDVRGAPWHIVGVFESGGDVHESEVLTDADTLLASLRRNIFQSVLVQLESPQSFDRFSRALAANPSIPVEVQKERQYYAQQAGAINTSIKLIAYLIGGIMAIGALFAALNSMHTAVSNRVREIATLKAVGFRGGSVVISVLAESLLLAMLGSLLGSAVAWVALNGHALSSSAGGSAGQFVFSLRVGWGTVVAATIWACSIGLLGGVFPALRAGRVPVAVALWAT